MSRRDFLKVTGGTLLGIGVGDWIYNKYQEYKINNAPAEGVDPNFNPPEAAGLPPTLTAKPTGTFQPGQNTNTPEPAPENKPLVDGFKIAEKIDLGSGDPMRWLLVANDHRAVLTPSAKPYAFSVESEQNNVFDWHNHTTYSYLEEHGLPVVWGHEGLPSLFFDYWAGFLRKPSGGGAVTRVEAQDAMLKNIIGASVYMFQSKDASLLPDSPEKISSIDPSVKVVRAQVIAGLFIPRWQKVSEVDGRSIPTDKSQVTFDWSGFLVDFVTTGYDRHTIDVVNWIKKTYPDDPRDHSRTHKLFSPLPNPNLVLAKFCIRAFAEDPPAPEVDASGNTIIEASYGRVIMALEIKKD